VPLFDCESLPPTTLADLAKKPPCLSKTDGGDLPAELMAGGPGHGYVPGTPIRKMTPRRSRDVKPGRPGCGLPGQRSRAFQQEQHLDTYGIAHGITESAPAFRGQGERARRDQRALAFAINRVPARRAGTGRPRARLQGFVIVPLLRTAEPRAGKSFAAPGLVTASFPAPGDDAERPATDEARGASVTGRFYRGRGRFGAWPVGIHAFRATAGWAMTNNRMAVVLTSSEVSEHATSRQAVG